MKRAALICSSFLISCGLISSAFAIGFDTGSTHGSTTSRSWNDSSGHHYQSHSSSTSTSVGAHVDNGALASMGASLLGSMIAKNTAKPVPQQPKAQEKLEPFLADSQFPAKINLTAANAKKRCNIICEKNDGEWTGDWLPAKGKAKASCTCHIKIFGDPVQDDF